MTDDASGNLLARWRQGDQEAAAELFRRYAGRLVGLARSRLSGRLGQRVDPEDVVHSVYRSFFAGARDGRYDLQRGGDLWRLLVAITLHKLYHQARDHSTSKRALERDVSFGSEDSLLGMGAQLLSHEPSPVDAAALVDVLEQIMNDLEPLQRRMLELRLKGCTVEEIAAETERGEATVRRLLDRVKQRLRQRNGDQSGA
jgi:RNA polymerase sigma-70 factor (ECF subfamily)